jgi:hypothetical protein
MGPGGAAVKPWAALKDGRLIVDGEPFLALGIQIDFLNCATPEGFDYLFPHLKRMGINTLFFPLFWSRLEPEEGRYDFSVAAHVLRRCAEYGFRISFLWFGSNQGGGFNPAPAWVKEERSRFRRVRGEDGAEQEKLCPECAETLLAEKRALDSFLRWLAETDARRLAILLQVENEPCLEMNPQRGRPGALMDGWNFRCHCPHCEAKFAAEGGDEWSFSARSLAAYFSALLKDQKAIHPLLAYTNFLLNPQRPGEDIDIYLRECPELDIVAVDYYGFGPADLAFAMRFFKRGRNPLFVAEHSSESVGDAGGNVFRAVCEFGAVAFDPWAVDHSFGWRAWRDKVRERPFVERDGSWSRAAEDYGASLRALGAGAWALARAAGSEDILCYCAEGGQPRSLEERRWGMAWRLQCGPQGRFALLKNAEDDFTLLGVGLQAVLESLDPGRPWSVEAGSWKAGLWLREGEAKVLRSNAAGKLLDMEEAVCLRIRLG